MQVLKKIVSLLLVAAMISSLALVAFAADASGADEKVGLKLCAFDSEGQELKAGTELAAGDTIKVQVKTTKAVTVNNLDFFVRYDKEVLECNENAFLNSRGNYQWPAGPMTSNDFNAKQFEFIASSVRDDEELKVGQSAWRLTFAIDGEPMAFAAGDVIAEMSFTAKSAADATQLEILMNTAQRNAQLEDGAWDASLADVKGEFTTENLTLSVAEGASDNISKFEANGSTEVYAKVGSNKMVKIDYTTKDGTALAAEDVTWTSDNETVVSVSDASVSKKTTAAYVSFRVKPSSVGVAHVTGTIGNHSVTFTYKVFAELPTTIKITTESDLSMNVAPGKKIQMTAVTYPVTPTATSVWPEQAVWKSSNEAVATVDSNGLVTTVGAGKATITVTLMGVTSAGKTISVADLSGGEYTVSMPEDQTVLSGSTVEIPVVIGSANTGVTKYNAYDMRLSYDPTQLELVTDALVGKTTTLEKGDGTVHVIHYGDVQDVTTTAFTLRFKVLAASGTATLTMTSAQVDISANALGADAKNATLTKAATVLTVDTRYNVELPAEMAGETWAAEGKDYTFSITNPDPFYIYTVAATMNGEDVAVIAGENGTYTIANVTGDLKITMTKVGKQFNVTFVGNAKEDVVNAASTANYGEDYTFKLNKDEKFQYTFETKIGEATYTVTGPDTEGNYKILGTAIKGDITITVTKKPLEGKIFDVSVEGSGKGDVTAPDQAIEGGDFVFTVVEEEGYIYSVAISINGSDYTKLAAPVVSGNAKTYTIPGADVTGPIVIVVTKDKAVNVTFENANPGDIRIFKENGTTKITDNKDLAKEGSDYVFTVIGIMKVYDLTVEVTENGVAKAIETEVKSSSNSRDNYTFTVKNVQDDLNIKLSCAASDDLVEVLVKPYVELDGKTVYMIATRTKAGNDQGLKLDTYDGYAMYTTDLYIGQFENPLTGKGNTFLWLTIVNEGEEFGKVQALQHLSYTNHRDSLNANKELPKPDGVANNADVNGSNLIDVNDAQLVYDIYKGAYQSFYMTNTGTNDTHIDPNYGIGASMTKFLEADVNRDMKVDINDAAAIINLIK